jgi:hypothetical protein
MSWENGSIREVELLSRAGKTCRIDAGGKLKVTEAGKKIPTRTREDGSIEFETTKDATYKLALLDQAPENYTSD